MRIDLHVHSTASDGTLRPAEVIRLAREVGLDVVALTDHDSAAGWPEAIDAAAHEGVGLVPGMEVSTKLRGAGVHVLAYLADPGEPGFAAELARIIDGREGRLGAIVGQLRDAGVDITEAEVRAQAGDAPAIGRPHVADVMVGKGVVADRDEAFAGWLGYGRPGFAVRYSTPTEELIRLVVRAGGVAVIAHPWGRGSRRVLDRATLAALRDQGLSGIEVDHHDHSADDRAALAALADDLGLLATGSSDFHGAGKVDHDLGSNLTDPAQFRRLLDLAADHAAASGRPVPAAVLA